MRDRGVYARAIGQGQLPGRTASGSLLWSGSVEGHPCNMGHTGRRVATYIAGLSTRVRRKRSTCCSSRGRSTGSSGRPRSGATSRIRYVVATVPPSPDPNAHRGGATVGVDDAVTDELRAHLVCAGQRAGAAAAGRAEERAHERGAPRARRPPDTVNIGRSALCGVASTQVRGARSS